MFRRMVVGSLCLVAIVQANPSAAELNAVRVAPQIEALCSAGATEGVRRTFRLQADDERPNFFHTGSPSDPDPAFVSVIENDLVKVRIMVNLTHRQGKYFIESAYVRYFPQQEPEAMASGGMSISALNYELRPSVPIGILAERNGDLGGFISYAQCNISLVP